MDRIDLSRRFSAGIMVPVSASQHGRLPALAMPNGADGFTEFSGYSGRYQVMAIGGVKLGGQPIDERKQQNKETPDCQQNCACLMFAHDTHL